MKKGDEIYLQREKKILLSDQNKKKKTKQNLNNKGFNDFIIRILSRTQEVKSKNNIIFLLFDKYK